MSEKIDLLTLKTPRGGFVLAATEKGLCRVDFFSDRDRTGAVGRCTAELLRRFAALEVPGDRGRLAGAGHWLRAFLEDPLKAGVYTGPLDPGGTDFQQRVWAVLSAIQAGKTRSYGEVARLVGQPRATRAVGAACGANPLLIFIPCHRVVGSDRSLTGFGGGLDLKQKLLAAEGFYEPRLEIFPAG